MRKRKEMKRKLLYEYNNNNVHVELFNDGTKIMETPGDEPLMPDFPTSLDLKITNYCDMGCPQCHEDSNLQGKSMNMLKVLNYLRPLPPGTELAIGGGNPLAFDKVAGMLHDMSHNMKLVPNLTLHETHLRLKDAEVSDLLRNGDIYGVGISPVKSRERPILIDYDHPKYGWPTAVFHMIAGYHNIDDLQHRNKVLILGYKNKGRGIKYHDKAVENNLYQWMTKIPLYFDKVQMSFDTLAIEQLNMRRFFSQEQWDKYYLGADGVTSFYIDGPELTYGISSTDTRRFPLTDIRSDFNAVRELARKDDSIL